MSLHFAPKEKVYFVLNSHGIVLTWSVMKDDYDFIYRFLDGIENDWEVSEQTEDPVVMVNHKVYKPE